MTLVPEHYLHITVILTISIRLRTATVSYLTCNRLPGEPSRSRLLTALIVADSYVKTLRHAQDSYRAFAVSIAYWCVYRIHNSCSKWCPCATIWQAVHLLKTCQATRCSSFSEMFPIKKKCYDTSYHWRMWHLPLLSYTVDDFIGVISYRCQFHLLSENTLHTSPFLIQYWSSLYEIS